MEISYEDVLLAYRQRHHKFDDITNEGITAEEIKADSTRHLATIRRNLAQLAKDGYAKVIGRRLSIDSLGRKQYSKAYIFLSPDEAEKQNAQGESKQNAPIKAERAHTRGKRGVHA